MTPNDKQLHVSEHEMQTVLPSTPHGHLLSHLAREVEEESTLQPSILSAPKQSPTTSNEASISGTVQAFPESHLSPSSHNARVLQRTSSPPPILGENITTPLQSKLKQSSTSWLLAGLTSSVLAFSTWFIYREFICTRKVPRHLQLSPGRTVTVVNILSQVNIFLAWTLVDSVFESLRWTMASRTQGILITSFIGMSRATDFVGVADLLRVPGWHRIWCIQRFFEPQTPP